MSESIHYSPAEALTLRIRDKLYASGTPSISWYNMADAVYNTLHEFAHTLNIGDTFELPNGLTVRVEFKPREKN